MTVGIVGLGLIGGSMAKAYAESGRHRILGCDKDPLITEFAMMAGACTEPLTKENMAQCDLLLIAIPPRAAVAWLQENAPNVASHTLVIDLCGTKRVVCQACFPLAAQYGFTFVGGHPMAGTHNSGFRYAREDLYRGQPMVLVPPEGHDMALLERVKTLLAPAGFGKLTVTTAAEHDRMIAFTSQMAHVVSNAYIKSPTASAHRGFSAGSYRDLTRVAWLNSHMWAELMMENRDYMLYELDVLLESLQAYRQAIEADDYHALQQLLEEGKLRKEEVDGH